MRVVEGSEEGVSWIENAMVEECFFGCAEAWLGVGSMESKLEGASEADLSGKVGKREIVLFPYIVSEVCDGVWGVTDEL